MREKNLYQIMGLDSSRCTTSQIKNRYRQLVKLYHPDIKGNEKKMIEINQAYETLSNPIKRLKYDQLLKTKIPPQTQHYSQKTKTNPMVRKSSVQPNLSNLIFKIKLSLSLACLALMIILGLRFIQLNNQVIVDQYPINFVNSSYRLTNTFQQKSFKNIKLIKITKQSSEQSMSFSSPPTVKQQCQSKNFILNPSKFFKSIFNNNQC